MYWLTSEEHKNLLRSAINSNTKRQYKNQRQNKQKRKRDCEEQRSFFTLMDHKEKFQNKLTVRLINPAKNENGRIRKVILDKINSSLRQSQKLTIGKYTKRYWMVYEN